jgi:hypothetical protein
VSEPVTFVSWRWQSPVGYRSVFAPHTVYALDEMLRRHYHQPFTHVCVTDQPEQLPGIKTIPMWEFGAAIPSPFGRHNPSCYRRLRVFAPDAGKLFGPRLVSIDLDTVIVNDITPLFETDADFKAWGCSDYKTQWLNGSLWMLRTGSHPEVWETFDPDKSPDISKRAGCFGSDQGWMRYVLGGKVPVWGEADGVYSYRKHIAPRGNVLPENARLVAFHGKVDPWSARAAHVDWIRKHYPQEVAA